jgi:hypothetical protein
MCMVVAIMSALVLWMARPKNNNQRGHIGLKSPESRVSGKFNPELAYNPVFRADRYWENPLAELEAENAELSGKLTAANEALHRATVVAPLRRWPNQSALRLSCGLSNSLRPIESS